MNRDNVFFAVSGFLLGLILGGVMIGPKVAAWRGGSGPAAATATTGALAPAVASDPAAGGPTMNMIRQKLDALKARVAADPRDAAAHAELGNLYMDAAKFEQALGYYEKSLAVRNDPGVKMDLGICYRETRQFDKALALFREVSAESPAQWQAQFNEAIVLADMGNLPAARAVVTRLRQTRPTDENIIRFERTLASAPK